MNNFTKKMLVVAALEAVGLSARAATLNVIPSAASATVGSTFNVTIAIDDLIDAGAPSLGDFDLDIQFSPGVLSYAGFSWGDTVHGDQLDLAGLGSLAQADESQAAFGHLNYFEISYDDVAALNTVQAGNFGLLTLTFSALANGASPIAIGINSLGDANGNALTAQINNANVNVSSVPIPATLPLFASALLLLGGRARNRMTR